MKTYTEKHSEKKAAEGHVEDIEKRGGIARIIKDEKTFIVEYFFPSGQEILHPETAIMLLEWNGIKHNLTVADYYENSFYFVLPNGNSVVKSHTYGVDVYGNDYILHPTLKQFDDICKCKLKIS
jgi:hypothetical protein